MQSTLVDSSKRGCAHSLEVFKKYPDLVSFLEVGSHSNFKCEDAMESLLFFCRVYKESLLEKGSLGEAVIISFIREVSEEIVTQTLNLNSLPFKREDVFLKVKSLFAESFELISRACTDQIVKSLEESISIFRKKIKELGMSSSLEDFLSDKGECLSIEIISDFERVIADHTGKCMERGDGCFKDDYSKHLRKCMNRTVRLFCQNSKLSYTDLRDLVYDVFYHLFLWITRSFFYRKLFSAPSELSASFDYEVDKFREYTTKNLLSDPSSELFIAIENCGKYIAPDLFDITVGTSLRSGVSAANCNDVLFVNNTKSDFFTFALLKNAIQPVKINCEHSIYINKKWMERKPSHCSDTNCSVGCIDVVNALVYFRACFSKCLAFVAPSHANSFTVHNLSGNLLHTVCYNMNAKIFSKMWDEPSFDPQPIMHKKTRQLILGSLWTLIFGDIDDYAKFYVDYISKFLDKYISELRDLLKANAKIKEEQIDQLFKLGNVVGDFCSYLDNKEQILGVEILDKIYEMIDNHEYFKQINGTNHKIRMDSRVETFCAGSGLDPTGVKTSVYRFLSSIFGHLALYFFQEKMYNPKSHLINIANPECILKSTRFMNLFNDLLLFHKLDSAIDDCVKSLKPKFLVEYFFEAESNGKNCLKRPFQSKDTKNYGAKIQKIVAPAPASSATATGVVVPASSSVMEGMLQLHIPSVFAPIKASPALLCNKVQCDHFFLNCREVDIRYKALYTDKGYSFYDINCTNIVKTLVYFEGCFEGYFIPLHSSNKCRLGIVTSLVHRVKGHILQSGMIKALCNRAEFDFGSVEKVVNKLVAENFKIFYATCVKKVSKSIAKYISELKSDFEKNIEKSALDKMFKLGGTLDGICRSHSSYSCDGLGVEIQKRVSELIDSCLDAGIVVSSGNLPRVETLKIFKSSGLQELSCFILRRAFMCFFYRNLSRLAEVNDVLSKKRGNFSSRLKTYILDFHRAPRFSDTLKIVVEYLSGYLRGRVIAGSRKVSEDVTFLIFTSSISSNYLDQQVFVSEQANSAVKESIASHSDVLLGQQSLGNEEGEAFDVSQQLLENEDDDFFDDIFDDISGLGFRADLNLAEITESIASSPGVFLDQQSLGNEEGEALDSSIADIFGFGLSANLNFEPEIEENMISSSDVFLDQQSLGNEEGEALDSSIADIFGFGLSANLNFEPEIEENMISSSDVFLGQQSLGNKEGDALDSSVNFSKLDFVDASVLSVREESFNLEALDFDILPTKYISEEGSGFGIEQQLFVEKELGVFDLYQEKRFNSRVLPSNSIVNSTSMQLSAFSNFSSARGVSK